MNQPKQDVWFLTGKFPDNTKDFPTRMCSIPRDRAILFPVVNCEVNPLEYPSLDTDEKLINHVIADEDKITRKECTFDRETIEAVRVKSDPMIFDLDIKPGIFAGAVGQTRAAADGYWVFLKPVDMGRHRIEIAGACEMGRLNTGATYTIDIVA